MRWQYLAFSIVLLMPCSAYGQSEISKRIKYWEDQGYGVNSKPVLKQPPLYVPPPKPQPQYEYIYKESPPKVYEYKPPVNNNSSKEDKINWLIEKGVVAAPTPVQVEEPKKDKPLTFVFGNSVKLPLSLVKNKLEIMPIGAKGFISPDTIKCDSHRQVWLDIDQVYGTKNEGRTIFVKKESTGYHILIEKTNTHKWICEEIPTGMNCVLVKTITVE